MNNDLLWGTILIIYHLVIAILLLAIFSSLFVKKSGVGYIFLIIIIFLGYSTLRKFFDDLPIAGIILCLIYLSLGIATFVNLKRKLVKLDSK